ncbi:hypothetical protein Ndes2526B_g07385 [Nannochloris sp. 'desiccata']|nr:hypothetical protein KSW81_004607 [Chlorella desiccata (nom. nud.)]KAH7618443.1 putative Origin of replication complex subunit 3 [Chlorella desiccata (nom. nud.)]
MEWIDELEGHEIGEDAAFTILAEGPPPLTSRQQNKTKKGQDTTWQEAAHDLTLQAYPKLYPKETEDSRLHRASAFETVWSSIESRIQSCLESTDAAVYESLLALARLHHPIDGLPRNTPAYGLHRIPTGLVLAGGVNSADHVRTFPTLANHLRSAGCYVALLRPYDFGKSVSDALNSALRQMSGLNETRADTFQALAAWYADELTCSTITAALAGTSTVHANRTVHTTITTSSHQINNKERPLVIIVESTEAVLDTMLSDLVYVLSEGWPQLPVTLVLGLNIAASAVPASLTDRALDCYSYNLATAVARLDTLVEKVLLSRWPGLLLDGDVVDILWGHFMKYYFSPGIIVKGWKLAALAHCRGQPLAALAAAAVGSDGGGGGGDNGLAISTAGKENSTEDREDALINAIKTAIAALPPAAATEARHQLASGNSGAKGNAIDTSVTEFIWAWRRWALALKVMVAAASTAGLTNGYTHWQLYESALDSKFSNSPAGKELLGRLERALKRLDDTTAMELMEKLFLLAKSVQNEESTSDHDRDGEDDGNVKSAFSNEGIELEMQLEELRAKMNMNSETFDEDAEQEQAFVAEEEGATTTAAAAAAPVKKRDRFFSKKSRKEALLSKAQANGASNKGKKSNTRGTFGEGALASHHPLGALVAAWLYPWLSKALRQPPTQLPAAKFFTCRDASSLDCLTAAPREAIHAALTRPHLYLPTLGSTNNNYHNNNNDNNNNNNNNDPAGPSTSKSASTALGAFATRAAAQDISLGITADVEDACLAYQLFDQDPSCANVAEWFTAFKAVHDAKDGEADGNGNGATEGSKSNNGKGKEKKEAAKGNKESAGSKKRKAVPVDAAVAAARAEKDRLLAARFSQATAELQFIGLIKPLRNRSRGDAVQRAVHMPAPLMGDV